MKLYHAFQTTKTYIYIRAAD